MKGVSVPFAAVTILRLLLNDEEVTATSTEPTWHCPVCGGNESQRLFGSRRAAGRGAVDAASFVPSSDSFGRTAGETVRCSHCGHGSLLAPPPDVALHEAYEEAEDELSLEEEAGQVATADRDLATMERWVRPGRLLDIGSWTGSFLVAAAARGWESEGIEPSAWACRRAAERGCVVRQTTFDEAELPDASLRAVVICDVLEHLPDPGAAVERIKRSLEPGGVLFATVPDAGGRVARLLGRRWWAVLPMHVQYFTRHSMGMLLQRHGLVVGTVATHPKVFSTRYYASRLERFAPVGGAIVPAVVNRLGLADRPFAPDLGDRMAIVARRPAGSSANRSYRRPPPTGSIITATWPRPGAATTRSRREISSSCSSNVTVGSARTSIRRATPVSKSRPALVSRETSFALVR
jgi:SAM-dependent methyltransferase